MQRLNFVVPGPPVAWHRPQLDTRSSRIDGRGVRAYKHKDDSRYQKALFSAATAAMQGWRVQSRESWNADGEFEITAYFYVPDLRRRDIDNLEKNLLDGLIGAPYNDDTQVVSVHKEKRLDRERPRTVVELCRVVGYLDE